MRLEAEPEGSTSRHSGSPCLASFDGVCPQTLERKGWRHCRLQRDPSKRDGHGLRPGEQRDGVGVATVGSTAGGGTGCEGPEGLEELRRAAGLLARLTNELSGPPARPFPDTEDTSGQAPLSGAGETPSAPQMSRQGRIPEAHLTTPPRTLGAGVSSESGKGPPFGRLGLPAGMLRWASANCSPILLPKISPRESASGFSESAERQPRAGGLHSGSSESKERNLDVPASPEPAALLACPSGPTARAGMLTSEHES